MKHSDSGLAPDEQVAHQYRLFSRAIRIAGLKQIAVLYPYLQERLDISLSEVVGKIVSIQGQRQPYSNQAYQTLTPPEQGQLV
jgi:hypothetical protein